MRILHLADRWNGRGGAYTYLHGLLAAQRAEGNDVWVAVGQGAGDSAGPVIVRPELAATRRRDGPFEALFRELRPDLLHLHTILNPAVLEWAGTKPAVITVQDHRYFCPTRGKWTAGGAVCAEAVARATCAACFSDVAYFSGIFDVTAERLRALRDLRVIVLSQYMRRELIAAGLDAGRIDVVRPAIHGLDTTARADGPPCVGFVGRLAEAKGVRDAVAAWRLSGVDLPLVMAGTGPLRAELEGQGAQVLGWLDRNKLSAFLRRARALLMPSRWQEPFGIVGLEAQAFGVPVVAWRSGGIEEWHDGPLAEWGDVPALADRLAEAVGRGAARA